MPKSPKKHAPVRVENLSAAEGAQTVNLNIIKMKQPERRIVEESDDDLLPLSRPEALGLPFAKTAMLERIRAGRFPTPVRINGRMFITRAALREFKKQLTREDSPVPQHAEAALAAARAADKRQPAIKKRARASDEAAA